MRRIDSLNQAREYVLKLRSKDRSVGLVPTMGALHEGHLSLARESLRQCDETIVSIFVNPAQFAPDEDLAKYPRTLEDDCRALESLGVSAVFVPTVDQMYPDGFSTFVDPPEVARAWEGVCRPVHFRGVATIVLKLFHALPATHAFFGRKDYQQLKVIEAMVLDLNIGIEIVGCETVREQDGLAMSSRNQYLSPADRKRALLLSRALDCAERMVASGQRDVSLIQNAMRQALTGALAESSDGQDDRRDHEQANKDDCVNQFPGVDRIDYAVIADPRTLVAMDTLDHLGIALIAAQIGETRLIDNRIISP